VDGRVVGWIDYTPSDTGFERGHRW
jgi:hypothetical protein